MLSQRRARETSCFLIIARPTLTPGRHYCPAPRCSCQLNSSFHFPCKASHNGTPSRLSVAARAPTTARFSPRTSGFPDKNQSQPRAACINSAKAAIKSKNNTVFFILLLSQFLGSFCVNTPVETPWIIRSYRCSRTWFREHPSHVVPTSGADNPKSQRHAGHVGCDAHTFPHFLLIHCHRFSVSRLLILWRKILISSLALRTYASDSSNIRFQSGPPSSGNRA